MPVLDIDGTTKAMFGISVGNSRVDVRSNNGIIEVRNNLGTWRVLQTATHMGVAAPTVNDDASLGYLIKDIWYYSNALYICSDNTIGAAIWVQIAGGGAANLDDVLVAEDSSIVVGEDGNIVVRG